MLATVAVRKAPTVVRRSILHHAHLPATIKVTAQVQLITAAQVVALHPEATELLLHQNRVVVTRVVLLREAVAAVTVAAAADRVVAAHHTQVVHPVAQEAQEAHPVHRAHQVVVHEVVEVEEGKIRILQET